MSCNEITGALPCGLPLALGSSGVEQTLSDYSIEGGLMFYLLNHPRISCLVSSRVYPYYVDDSSAFPAISFEISEVPEPAITRQSGIAKASIDVTSWSDNFNDSVRVANEVRRALQGFRGWMGNVAVMAVQFDDMDDEKQSPADDSPVYWFGRTMSFTLTYLVEIHTF